MKPNARRRWTDADFSDLSWHDCHVWGIAFRVGSPDDDDWTSDLLLDLDFITDWICEADGSCEFLVAPAELVFHGVTDPRTAIDWGERGFQTAIQLPSIEAIERERIDDQRVYLDQPYFRWRIRLNAPAGGALEFGAVGFTQTLRGEPRRTPRQHLTLRERGSSHDARKGT
jgi:hypothetical protein